MRTMIEIDNDLMEKALKSGPYKTKKEVIAEGLKLLVPVDETGTQWETYLIDDNMATEDLIIADLDGDGRPEIIAAGRVTNNLFIFWNKTAD